MRLQSRATREVFDAHWELPSSRLIGHPVLIIEDGAGGRPVPRALADQYVLVVATLEEMRVGVDSGFRFHEQRSLSDRRVPQP
ncbi:MAG TPA: hypothetical protein VKA06_05070 [Spirochaetia bacterium]|nr:hypothetical protein [Spirochaetia bacterium]